MKVYIVIEYMSDEQQILSVHSSEVVAREKLNLLDKEAEKVHFWYRPVYGIKEWEVDA